MDEDRGLIGEGLAAVRDMLCEAMAHTGLHLVPKTLTKTAAATMRSALRQAATLLRRLILLMAAGLAPPPVRKRPQDRQQALSRPQARFSLFAAHRYDAAALDALDNRPPTRTASGPVPAGPLITRLNHLLALLDNPHPLAVRMARRLLALRRRGDPRPMLLPQPNLFRCHPRLALIAAVLPLKIREALCDWYDTGP